MLRRRLIRHRRGGLPVLFFIGAAMLFGPANFARGAVFFVQALLVLVPLGLLVLAGYLAWRWKHPPAEFGAPKLSGPERWSLSDSEWAVVAGNPQLPALEGRRCPACGASITASRGPVVEESSGTARFDVFFECGACRWGHQGVAVH